MSLIEKISPEQQIDVKRILRYFNCKLIGSILLIDYGLSIKDINDIDIMLSSSENVDFLRNLMQDQGYTEKIETIRHTIYSTPQLTKTLVFIKENLLPIHIVVSKEMKLYPLNEIIEKKLQRGSLNDLKQIKKYVEFKINQQQ